MTQLAALLLVYCASALVCAATRRSGRARLPLLDTPVRSRSAWLAALLLWALAIALWQRVEPGAPALMATSVALMATSTLVTLLTPFYPRVVWTTAALALPVAALSAWLGGGHG